MKTLSQILPAKRVTMIQALVCFALVLAICAFSFGTIFSLSFELDEEMQTQIDGFVEQLTGGADVELNISTKIDVSLPFLIASFGSLGEIGEAVMNMMQNAESPDFNPEAAAGVLIEKLADQDFVNLIVFIVLLIASFGTNVVVGLCNILLLIATFTLPITAVISAIRAIFGLLFNIKDMGNAHHKISRALYSIISIFPLLLLVMVVVPEVQFGSAVYATIICCAIGLAVNLIASRLKKYEGEDFRYVNILQITCAASLVGYLLFFFNIMKSNIINAATDALAKGTGDAVGDAIQGGKVDYVPIFLTVLLIAAVFAVIDNLPRILTRLACMSKSHADAYIKPAVVSLLVVILPFVMQSMDMGFEIADEYMSAFITCCVGVVLMAAAEVVIAVLPKSVCPNVSAVRRQEIVTGAYTPVEEAPVEEALAAEEAPATEEAPAEETPVEETV